jgi:superfamily II DNA/RNA helicase
MEKLDVLMHFLNLKRRRKRYYICKTKKAAVKYSKEFSYQSFSSGALHEVCHKGYVIASWSNFAKDTSIY